MKRLLLALCAGLVVAAPASSAAQSPALEIVLERAGAYMLEFERQLSGVVAEEHYVQDDRTFLGTRDPKTGEILPRHRELRSDLILVKPEGADRWIYFRDVFEVDGAAVADRGERLAKLFLESPLSVAEQVRALKSESARYNIGNIVRTTNEPVLAMLFLEPSNQPRFKFTRVSAGNVKPFAGLAEPSAIWALEYREVQSDTFVRTTEGRDVPSHGRFWIDADTGHVLRTEHIVEDQGSRGQIDVSYRREPTLGMLVPSELHEQYRTRPDLTWIDAFATYELFRTFQVQVDERLTVGDETIKAVR